MSHPVPTNMYVCTYMFNHNSREPGTNTTHIFISLFGRGKWRAGNPERKGARGGGGLGGGRMEKRGGRGSRH